MVSIIEENLATNGDNEYFDSLLKDKYEFNAFMQRKNVNSKAHKHKYFRIICQLDKSSIHKIDNSELMLEKGEFLIIKPFQMYSTNNTDTNIINIIITEKFLKNFLIESSFDTKIINLLKVLFSNLNINKQKNSSKIDQIVQDIYINLPKINDPLYYIGLKINIMNFLVELINNIKLSNYPQLSQNLDVVTYIRYDVKKASIKKYAKANHLSINKMSKKIRNIYGLTFNEIRNELRIQYIIDSFKNTEKDINIILEEIGYKNLNYFDLIFISRYDMSVNEFREYIKTLDNIPSV